MILLLYIVLVGFLAAIINGLTSVGGGILFLLFLIFISPVDSNGNVFSMQVLTAFTMVHSFTCSVTGSGYFIKKKSYEKKISLWFGAGAFAGGLGGSLLAHNISGHFLQLLFFLLALLAAVSVFFNNVDRFKIKKQLSHRWLLPIGCVLGVVGGIFGLGIGFLLLPTLVILYNLPVKKAVGSSMVTAVMLLTGTLIGKIGTPDFDFRLSLFIVLAAFVGSLAGSFIGIRLRSRYLQIIIAVLLIGISIKFLIGWLF